MLCKKVLPLLSEFFDGVLDADSAVQVSQHLSQCDGCRKEFDSFSALRAKLKSLDRVQAPEYLRSLVQHRLAKEPWRMRVKNELSRYWSIIRTTEGMWYATRAVGSVMATVFFMLISSGVTPYVVQAEAPVMREPLPLNPAYGPKVSVNVSKKLGTFPTPVPSKLSGRSGPAAINDLYLMKYGESVSQVGKDDYLSILATIDRRGTAKVESVIEHPSDQNLLYEFNQVIESARVRPARENGRAVSSSVVFTFSKIFVVPD
jgi:hypothetical protein